MGVYPNVGGGGLKVWHKLGVAPHSFTAFFLLLFFLRDADENHMSFCFYKRMGTSSNKLSNTQVESSYYTEQANTFITPDFIYQGNVWPNWIAKMNLQWFPWKIKHLSVWSPFAPRRSITHLDWNVCSHWLGGQAVVCVYRFTDLYILICYRIPHDTLLEQFYIISKWQRIASLSFS